MLTIFYFVTCTNLAWRGGGLLFGFVRDPRQQAPIIKILSALNKHFKTWRIFKWSRNLLNFGCVLFVGYRFTSVVSSKGSDHAMLAIIVQVTDVLICYSFSCVFDIQANLKGHTTTPSLISQYLQFFDRNQALHPVQSRRAPKCPKKLQQ